MTTNRSLLERYDIPIGHLDFKYIDDCSNAKEMEKIVLILRSGQEGYYPDLTKYAEEKLRVLKPGSKVLRTEVPVLTKNLLDSSDWKEINEPIKEWIGDMRKKDRILSKVSQEEQLQEVDSKLPPVREALKIDPAAAKIEDEPKPKAERIKAIEYNKWDKYDADTEILKMDLEEERAKEEIEKKNRLNLKKSAEMKPNLVDEVDINKLTEIEKEHLSLRFKDRGNEFFRTKDFKEALNEYTKCIQVMPSVNGFNNRALAYLKLNDFENCIKDSNSCLEMDPKNVKARIRKAQAYIGLNKKREAYDIYKEAQSIDPDNATATTQLKELEKHLADVAPNSATRIRIIEEQSSPCVPPAKLSDASTQPSKQTVDKKYQADEKKVGKSAKFPAVTQQKQEEDLSKLVMPNKIVKSKFKTAVEAMGNIQKQTKAKISAAKQKAQSAPEVKITLDTNRLDSSKKGCLIEEI